jgi:hypothetical protein
MTTITPSPACAAWFEFAEPVLVAPVAALDTLEAPDCTAEEFAINEVMLDPTPVYEDAIEDAAEPIFDSILPPIEVAREEMS